MTCTFLNQFIYGIKLFEHPADLERLSPFFYKGGLILDESLVKCHVEELKHNPDIAEECEKKVDSEKKTVDKGPKIQSLPKDNLFWNVFIFVYGLTEYKLIGSKYMNREWEEKNKIRAAYMNKPKELQTTNQKITLGNAKEMMSEYMTGGKTTLLGLVGLAVYYKVPIFLFDNVKKTYLSFIPQSTEHPACILFKTDNRGYVEASDKGYRVGGYELYSGEKSLETLCDESFGLESYQKPLRAISTYKRAELNTIAENHGITFHDKTKDDVYRELSQHLVWLI
jgi:hypothetical protein